MATAPSQAGFTQFIRDSMGITTAQLPDNSEWITLAYDVAVELAYIGVVQAGFANLYTLMVYNLGGSNLVEWTPDQSGQDVFAKLREKYNLNAFVSGVIQSASDEGTSESMVVQEAAKNFTLADLQYLKTPWGRTYLSIAQRAGTLWGIT